MYPVTFSTNIDAGLIGMQTPTIHQFVFDKLVERLQQLKSFSIKVVNRSLTNRNMNMFQEVVMNPIIWNQLELGRIDRICFQTSAILNWSIEMLRKLRNKQVSMLVFEYLSSIFLNKP